MVGCKLLDFTKTKPGGWLKGNADMTWLCRFSSWTLKINLKPAFRGPKFAMFLRSPLIKSRTVALERPDFESFFRSRVGNAPYKKPCVFEVFTGWDLPLVRRQTRN
jgi:hypothetical protein